VVLAATSTPRYSARLSFRSTKQWSITRTEAEHVQTKSFPGTWVVEAIERGGVDPSRLAEHLPAAFDQLLHAPDTLSPDDLLDLLSECATMSGDRNFGLHMADYLELTRIGTYGYLLLNAPTIREFLELAARYYPLIYQGGRLEFSTMGTVAHFRFTIIRPCHRDSRHLNEWTIGYFAKFIRSRIHPSWMPRGATFTNGMPDNLDELRRTVGSELTFDAKFTGFDIDSAVLETPITAADPVLLRIISHHADDLIQELGKKHPFRAQVRLLIMEGLEHDQAKAEIVARRLNISLSSFKRRLQEEKLDFRSLRDGIIKDLSERALSETSLPLSDIARKMGYSELSAFTRAFTRFSDFSPLKYRQLSKHRVVSRTH
jgi:AraC-like DNA-binding protein